jgi:hypothetical protein
VTSHRPNVSVSCNLSDGCVAREGRAQEGPSCPCAHE